MANFDHKDFFEAEVLGLLTEVRDKCLARGIHFAMVFDVKYEDEDGELVIAAMASPVRDGEGVSETVLAARRAIQEFKAHESAQEESFPGQTRQ
jgi:hypothetical protein